jgi:hypothetical protein
VASTAAAPCRRCRGWRYRPPRSESRRCLMSLMPAHAERGRRRPGRNCGPKRRPAARRSSACPRNTTTAIAVDRALDGLAGRAGCSGRATSTPPKSRRRTRDALVGVTVMLTTASRGYSSALPLILSQETPCRKRSSSPCSTITRR